MVASPALIRLAAGPVRVVLSPEAGGAIAQLAVEREGDLVDLLRPSSDEALAGTNARALGSYPLVPFSNRIAHARFRFGGQDYRLNANFPPEPHAIHGDGWQRPWSVAAQTERTATLDYTHDGAAAGGSGWPFRYRAHQRFGVDEAGLTVEIGATNLESFAWPFGCGLHPYFRWAPYLRLTADLPSVWMWDTLKLPVARIPTPSAWDMRSGAVAPSLNLDHCFAGWNGWARLEWPELGLGMTLEADPLFDHCVVAVLPGSRAVAVEPVSNANDGINLLDRGDPDHGLRMLAPGATLSGRVRFGVLA